jgi:hypothetical protein
MFAVADCNSDLYMFIPEQMQWISYSASIAGGSPPRRLTFGFTEAFGTLYVFGGQNTQGDCFHYFVPISRDGSNLASKCIFPVAGKVSYSTNDLFQFNISNLIWHDLGGTVHGLLPLPRQLPGLASINSQIFVFGGQDEQGEKCHSPFSCKGLGQS